MIVQMYVRENFYRNRLCTESEELPNRWILEQVGVRGSCSARWFEFRAYCIFLHESCLPSCDWGTNGSVSGVSSHWPARAQPVERDGFICPMQCPLAKPVYSMRTFKYMLCPNGGISGPLIQCWNLALSCKCSGANSEAANIFVAGSISNVQ